MRSMVRRSMLPRPVRSSSRLGRRRRLEGQKRSPTPPAMITTSTSLLLDHLNPDRRRHLAVQAQVDGVLTEGLDGLGKHDLATIDTVALLLELAHDVEARHRAVHLVLFAHLHRDRHGEIAKLGRASARRRRDLHVALDEMALVLLEHLLVAVGGREREIARKEIVAREARLHLDGLAAGAELLHAVEQYDFHDLTFLRA